MKCSNILNKIYFFFTDLFFFVDFFVDLFFLGDFLTDLFFLGDFFVDFFTDLFFLGDFFVDLLTDLFFLGDFFVDLFTDLFLGDLTDLSFLVGLSYRSTEYDLFNIFFTSDVLFAGIFVI